MDIERIEHIAFNAFNEGYRRGKADRPSGEWIQNDKIGTFKVWDCSRCGIHMETRWKFRPWCGAKMKGADDVI